MGIDARDFEAIKSFCQPWSGKGLDCMILGDCTFHVSGLNLGSFADACGFRFVHTLDIAGDPTHKVDLTEVPQHLQNRYAVVIDAGTLYCCLDIMAAWRGALSLLKTSSGIFHCAALTGYFGDGRGYYSLSPRLFRDVYAQSGFEITRMAVRATRSKNDRMIDIGSNDTFAVDASHDNIKFGARFRQHIKILPADAQIICGATRKLHSEYNI